MHPQEKGNIRLEEIPEIKEFKNQEEVVRVKVYEVGICGTDRSIVEGFHAKAPEGFDYLILGHENLGRVQSVGREVEQYGFHPGDWVVSTVRRPDDCSNCLAGEPDMCRKGNYTERGIKGLHGFLREFYEERPEYLIRIPPTFASVGVLVEPLSVVEKAISQAWQIQQRLEWNPQLAFVLGAGPVGLLAALLLRLKNLRTIVYSRGENERRIAILQEIGCEYVSTQTCTLSQLKEKFGPADFILEATGNGNVAMHAMDLLERNGVLSLISISEGDRSLIICSDCFNLNLVLGNRLLFGSVNANRRDYERAVHDLEKIQERHPQVLDRLITQRYCLKDFKEALKPGPDVIKSVIQVNDQE